MQLINWNCPQHNKLIKGFEILFWDTISIVACKITIFFLKIWVNQAIHSDKTVMQS